MIMRGLTNIHLSGAHAVTVQNSTKELLNRSVNNRIKIHLPLRKTHVHEQ